MDSDTASDRTYSVGDRRLRDRLAAPDQPATQATLRLPMGASLIVILASSLGLWATIAVAISSLASAFAP